MSLKLFQELQRRFTMPATMPASTTNILLPSANNNYAIQGSRGESWSAARRQQRRLSNRKNLARPLYRKDIFYSGSIVNLPQYRQSKADIRSYMASVTTIPAEESDEEVSQSILLFSYSSLFGWSTSGMSLRVLSVVPTVHF